MQEKLSKLHRAMKTEKIKDITVSYSSENNNLHIEDVTLDIETNNATKLDQLVLDLCCDYLQSQFSFEDLSNVTGTLIVAMQDSGLKLRAIHQKCVFTDIEQEFRLGLTEKTLAAT